MQVRVVSVPATHPYIDVGLDPATVEQVDPAPAYDAPPHSAWAPSPVFDEGWVTANAHRFDVCHVHFGFEGVSLRAIDRFCSALRAHSKPLVLTVHDLANPQLLPQEQPAYYAKLARLISAAAQVTTLTTGAAHEVSARYGRRALVVEHPPLDGTVSHARLCPPPRHLETPDNSAALRVGVLLKDARPSVDLDLIRQLGLAVNASSDWSLQILHHTHIRAGREAAVASLLADAQALDRIFTTPTARLSDEELASWIADLDLLALPYSHGTHSGLLELANDLGTRTLVPQVGYLPEQHCRVNIVLESTDSASVAAALREAAGSPELPPLVDPERRRRIRAFRAEHSAIYRRVTVRRQSTGAHGVDRTLSILLLSAFEHPVCQPHRGGLESHVWYLASELSRRGHRVTLAAPQGSDFLDPAIPALTYPPYTWPSHIPRSDARLPPPLARLEAASLRRALDYAYANPGSFDVIHDHSADPLPLLAPGPVPLVTTLHTPPVEPFVSTLAAAPGFTSGHLLTVSQHTADQWAAHGITPQVVANGVMTNSWTLGAGGPQLCWFGRICSEKAPHLAIATAVELGLPIAIAGPIGEPQYAHEVFLPAVQAAGDLVTWHGPLPVRELAHLVASSAVALVTPEWDEPFGQVVVESLACGTPVVAIGRGGLKETFFAADGVFLAEPHPDQRTQVAALAEAADHVLALSAPGGAGLPIRSMARATAVEKFSFDRTVDALVGHYRAAMACHPFHQNMATES